MRGLLTHLKSNARTWRWVVAIVVLLVIGLPLVYSAIVVPLSPRDQMLASIAMIVFAVVAGFSRALRPLIIFLSCFASMRYFYWRVTSTINMETVADQTVSFTLLGAEIYGLLILFLGYFQTIEVEKRRVPRVSRQPSVDVFIPTYNEPLEVVRRTVIGALAMDYPARTIYVLDDGNRPEMKRMAEEHGVRYLARSDNRHAKAGNLNNALAHTDGELVAIFDADHVPVRGFLEKTVPFFEDSRVALVQTAQNFFNADPYERNLGLTGKIPPEQDFFYHVIQPANDFWNSAFFCGSCAVLRRDALDAIGGFKTETVTEDAHTALELHSRGHRSVYLPMALAAGLATETYRAHVTQRMRWARGMAQILRLDCPLWKRGLTLPQRLNYFNAMLHFFFGIPRMILILAPLSFLLFGIHPIRADVAAVVAYILPHIGLSMIAASIISKNHRHSLWSGVYEVSIAPYTALATLAAVVSPRKGAFKVTDKGTSLDQTRFDYATSWPTLVLLGLSAIALGVAFPARLAAYAWNGGDPGVLDAILINSVWAVANFFVLVAAATVALEKIQTREAPRLARSRPCRLTNARGTLSCRSLDLSESGVRVTAAREAALPDRCEVEIEGHEGERIRVGAKRVWARRGEGGRQEAAFSFQQVDGTTHTALVRALFSDDRSWTERRYPVDNVLRSFWYLVTTFWRVTAPSKPKPGLEAHDDAGTGVGAPEEAAAGS